MKARSLVAVAAGVLVAAGAVVTAPASAGHSRSHCVADGPGVTAHCLEIEVPVPPGLHVPESTVRVLLPDDYYSDPERRYPVLYLMHGAGDTYADWTNSGSKGDPGAISSGEPVIIVMPDAGSGHQAGHERDAGWYSDWVTDPQTLPPADCPTPPDWETFHTAVLVDALENGRFVDRVLGGGEHRGIAGLSMGGFGALSYAARHDDAYAVAASFSGAVNTMYRAPGTGVGFEAAHATPFGNFGTPNDCVWGDQALAAGEWRAHNPTDLAGELADVELFLAWGDGTPSGPFNPAASGGHALEFFIAEMHTDPVEGFLPALSARGISWHERHTPGFVHDWTNWNDALDWALPGIVDALS